MRKLLPIRYGVIRRYFEKFKYQKKKREEVLAAVEESEEFIRKLLGDEYKPYHVAIPEIGSFMKEIRKQEAEKEEARLERLGKSKKIQALDARALKSKQPKIMQIKE